MAIEKHIKINVDTKGAVKSFDKLGTTIQEQKDITIEFEKELHRLEQQLLSISKGNLAQQKATKDRIVSLKAALKDQRLSLKELNNERGKANKVTEINTTSLSKNYGVVQLLDQVTGGLASQVRSVVDANRLFNISLKGTRAALIATGVGAFVVALGLVVAYWEDISDAITGASKAIVAQNKLITQQLSTDEAQLGILNKKRQLLILEGKDTSNINGLIKEKLNLIREENAVLIKNLKTKIKEAEAVSVEAVWWKRILLFREGITKNTGSEADKKAAAERIEKLKEELALLEAKNVEIEITQFKEANPEQKKAEETKKDDEKIGFDDTIQKRLEAETEALEGIARIRQEFADKNRDNEAAQDEIDRERQLLEIEQLIADEVFKREAIAEVNKFYDEQAITRAEKQAAADKKIKEDAAATDLKIADLKEQSRNKQLAGVANALGETSDLLGAATVEGKALAIAQAGISTFLTAQQAYQAAFTPVPTVASPALGAIFAGLAVAGGLASIAKIASVKVPSSGGGGSGRGGISASKPPAPPSFNLVQGTASNQISNSLQTQEPVRAIVSRDVTSAQEANRNSENNSTL